MSGYREFPKYVSHKTVQALELAEIGPAEHLQPTNGPGGFHRLLKFAAHGFSDVWAPEEMFSRYVPVPGDYYVVYEDGYKSFSPAKAFVEGYRPAPPAGVQAPWGEVIAELESDAHRPR